MLSFPPDRRSRAHVAQRERDALRHPTRNPVRFSMLLVVRNSYISFFIYRVKVYPAIMNKANINSLEEFMSDIFKQRLELR
jgi:hypothetical protein